ncbi:F0F1 ATP synthase subunit epsilon [Oenococcus oeni]|uniref:ATP synthase epsilon chain n=3 Tax=Oenococcus oeni TaxID=1247 RepID=A0A483BD84_OENOE|nr:F0F1 ATP synthase subunit epsilon [Oenococcus oeni]EAV39710.1 ATP synthase, epsilon subunit [Oenococcus oeni ATCC BAA-1163]KGO16599.1 ATP synthase subunit epsilon [Oenococcus oeni X2L]EJO00061.1 F0F1-type ATP synthase, epsilon subunit [Oenococcus oeni AWRIB418]KDE87287.1 ATP synthase subunit epsilon [Oenococcus oeni]KEP88669.1 F0F1 ATP synthase subunit epsilon [Oenococcus oeni IOEB_0501]
MAEDGSTTKNKLTISIVTPDGTVYNQSDVNLTVLDTSIGQMGIMANHVPIVVALKISQMRIHRGEKEDLYTVNGGFAEFSNNVLTVVADSAENAEDIDVNRAHAAEQRAKARAQNAKTADERARARVALARAINRINTSKVR